MENKYLNLKISQVMRMKQIIVKGKNSIKKFTKFHPDEKTFYLTLLDYEGGKKEIGYISNTNTLKSVCFHKGKEITFEEF